MRNLKNEQKAIENIRSFWHEVGQMELAKKIKAVKFGNDYDNNLARQCAGRTLLSMYSVIRRYDARNKASTVAA